MIILYAFIISIIIIIILLYQKIEKFTTDEILQNLGNIYKNDLLKVKKIQADNFYPVDSMYFSAKNIDPSKLFGGRWIQEDAGRFGYNTNILSGGNRNFYVWWRHS